MTATIPSERVHLILAKSGPVYGRLTLQERIVTVEAIEDLWRKIAPVSPKGMPLHFAQDGREIGKIITAARVEHENGAFITVDAVITDQNILGQPWLKLDQIVRAAIEHDLMLPPDEAL